MNTLTIPKGLVRPALFDAAALLMILLMPGFAHLTAIPVYMIEPMRVALVAAMIHTTGRNAYLLAAVLPFFSWLVSGHPQALKALIMSLELVLNVWLYYFLAGKTRSRFLAMAGAITASKFACYLLYWPVFSWSFVVAEADPIFLAIQAVTMIIFSGYAGLMRNNHHDPTPRERS